MITRASALVFLALSLARARHLRSPQNEEVTDGERVLYNEDLPDGDVVRHRRAQASSQRDLAFPILNSMELFKTESTIWSPPSAPDNRSTLTRAHYLVLPAWFDGEARLPHDTFRMNEMMQEVSDYYKDMSWGHLNLTWDVLDSVMLPGVSKANATLIPAKLGALDHIKNTLGLVKRRDFTGVVLLYSQADAGQMRWGDGFAHVNGDFIWARLPSRFGVIRHEIGHSFGHHHHLANTYEWRKERGKTNQFDGFTMMAGGNNYDVSDFQPAAKWHYNWIPDEAVVLMQPEGASAACPQCLSTVSGLVLTSFDDPDSPPSSTNLKAVHIPVMGNHDEKPNVYSYWLSYRGHGNDGLAAGGLSMHTSHFQLRGLFAATFNSLRLDAIGDTSNMTDSFVTPGTCYVVSPPALFMDQSPAAAEAVQPIVCVDALNKGKNITVSVSFLDAESPPENNIDLGSTRNLGCSAVGRDNAEHTVIVEEGRPHLIHVQGTGLRGTISLSMCAKSGGSVQAYLYDSYGAYQSLTAAQDCPLTSEIEYIAEYGEAYILLQHGENGSGTISIAASCHVASCHANQFFDGSICVDCPGDSIAPAESTDSSACVPCEEGLSVRHPKSPECVDLNILSPTKSPTVAPTASPTVQQPTRIVANTVPQQTTTTTQTLDREVTITRTAPPPRGSVLFRLVDVPRNETVLNLHDGAVVNVTALGVSAPTRFNIEAVSLDGAVQSVHFVESDVTETTVPFAYCGTTQKRFRSCFDLIVSPFRKTVSVIPYPDAAQAGASYPKQSVSFWIRH